MQHSSDDGRAGRESAEHAIRPAARRFQNARMPLAYSDWGNEGAPIILLIHGNRDHGRSWDAIAGALRKDYHIIAPDLRGHGDSGWSQDGHYNFAAYLSDLAALCDALEVSPDRRVTLIGHSLGAHIALRFAEALCDHAERVVAIEAVGAPPDMEAARISQPVDQRIRTWFEERRLAESASPRRFGSVEEAAARMQSRHRYLTDGQAKHLTRHGLRALTGGGWQWKHDPYLAVWPFPDITLDETRTLWRNVTCPTLLIYGEQSWPSGVPAELVQQLPNMREVRLVGSGHWPQHDAPESCLAAITHFLRS